ncbi:MAG: hypothetical protein DVB22_000071 [Verrucomicrobia bacterium]|nr:MAG: hypothetical protein DVB22_000071 [Verrucomicrobiota bacterium]
MKPTLTLLTAVFLAPLAALHAAEPFPTPAALWKDYDPDQGDFKEEVVKEETRDGILNRDSYISAYVLGEEIRGYCRYRVKVGATKAPGLLAVHGWMGAAEPDRKFVEDGWAVMAHDYCGRTGDRPHFTKYPEKLRHGNMDRTVAGPVRAQDLDGKQITDPRQTSDYVWYAIQRRVLSYLEQAGSVFPRRKCDNNAAQGLVGRREDVSRKYSEAKDWHCLAALDCRTGKGSVSISLES